MLKRLLSKLLGLDKHRGGSSYRPYRSSDDYGKYGHGHRPPGPRHDQYGRHHYKKKGSSSSYSS
ncbi:hypothetical protein ACHHV8_32330 [Paenibacillus sp. TAB 01]|uniref:hypothetical protein n=1 Tax=Paenibacillus sp. TAB 01 TaxID=3368988 RepID=UPI0037513420